MSTLKTVNIQHPSASTPAITLDSAGAMTGSFPYPNRNLLYNGAMAVNQRSASVSNITGSDYFTADRWGFAPITMGTWTNTIENDAPSGSGISRSWKATCTTADSSPAAGDYIVFYQRLEGQDLQRVMKGSANAQPLTLSFWVKSNVTGTYIANAYDQTNNRQISLAYTINSSATWEKKIITFPADTTGTLANSNAAAFTVHWFLGAGSTYTTGSLITSWTALNWASNGMATGQVNVANSTNNYWQITGIQLETGSVATPFEFKSYGQELRECQRYYEICNIFFAYIGYKGGCVYFNTEKRVAPTSVTFYTGSNKSGTAGQLTEANTSGSGYNVTNFESHVRSIQSIATSYSGTSNMAGSVVVSSEL